MSADLLQRLESVTSRLESIANTIGAGSSSGSSASQPNGLYANGTVSDAKTIAYEKFHNERVVPFIKTAASIKGVESISKLAEIAYSTQQNVVAATSQCKKPSDKELLTFVNPIVQVMESSAKGVDRKSPLFNHQQSWAEAVQSFQWIMTTTPKQTITDALEATDFYLVKILTAAKNSNDTASSDYAKQLKALLQALAAYTLEHFRAGLEWNPKGIPLAQYKPGVASPALSSSSKVAPPAAPAAPPSAPPPPAPSAPSSAPAPATTATGMGAVFGELTGTGGAFKLNKVTDDMKAKNRKNEPALESKQPAAKAATNISSTKPPAATAVSKPASTNLVKGTWFVENYANSGDVTVPNVQLKENVFISNCANVNIAIPDKSKSVTVNSCKRVSVTFKSLVSIFEVVNSQNIKIECLDTVPSIQIDKSSGVQIFLSRAGVAVVPNIITSNVSELNLVVPGVSDEDDPVELPVPEQYISKYDPQTKKIVTEAVSHSSSG